jgi:hypothetical protein
VSYSIFDSVTISADGKSVAVAGLDGKVVLYPLDAGAPRAVPKLADGFTPLRWCSGNALLVYRAGEVPVQILRVNVETGDQTPWKELAPAYRTGFTGLSEVRVSANCQSLGYSSLYFTSELLTVDGLR